MAEPLTWLLLGDFETCLKRITVANGFRTNAGLIVTREPSRVPDTGQAVIGLVLGQLDPPAQRELARTHWQVTVAVVGKIAVENNDDQAQTHALLDDITRCFNGQQATFGSGRTFPTFVSATPLPPEAGVKWLGVRVLYTAHVLR